MLPTSSTSSGFNVYHSYCTSFLCYRSIQIGHKVYNRVIIIIIISMQY